MLLCDDIIFWQEPLATAYDLAIINVIVDLQATAMQVFRECLKSAFKTAISKMLVSLATEVKKVKVEFEPPPEPGYSGIANVRYEKGWVKPKR